MDLFDDCNGCMDRFIGCHSTCTRYARAKEKNDKIKSARQADKDCREYKYRIKCESMAKQAIRKKRHIEYRRNFK